MTPPGTTSPGTNEPPVAVALIDGEHYPPVVLDTLARLRGRYRLVGAVFLGGEEKLRDPVGDEELAALYGLPLRRAREGGAGGATVRGPPPAPPSTPCCAIRVRASSLTCPTSRC